jgi:GNAT superfamily N-acetyltransferase
VTDVVVEACYPAEEERDVVLRSGSTLRLRPVRPGDAAGLHAFYGRLQPDSLYFRFFSARVVDEQAAAGFCRVDYENEFALVGDAGGRIVAIAQYFRLTKHPERRGRLRRRGRPPGQGIGTRLLERLAEIARARGIRTFEAEVLQPNRRMIDVFRNCGRGPRTALRGGAERVILDIEATAAYEERAPIARRRRPTHAPAVRAPRRGRHRGERRAREDRPRSSTTSASDFAEPWCR